MTVVTTNELLEWMLSFSLGVKFHFYRRCKLQQLERTSKRAWSSRHHGSQSLWRQGYH